MASSGPLYPSTTVDDATVGTEAWVNPNNGQVDDGVYTTTTPNSGVPKDNSIKIVKGGTISGTDKSAGAVWGGASYASFGGSADLWGLSWTVADINSSTFGVAISALTTGTKGDPSLTSHYLKVTNFGFTIPAGATINGILAEVKRATFNAGGGETGGEIDAVRITITYTVSAGFTGPGNVYALDGVYATSPAGSGDVTIQLSGDGGTTYSSVLTSTFTGTQALNTFGAGAAELWGETWFGSEVSNTNFRMKIGIDGIYQVYKNFGFSPGSSVVLTGIEVAMSAKWDGSTTSIDLVEAKIHYGTSTTPVQAGSVAFVTDGGQDGTGAIAAYNGSNWFTAGSDSLVIQTIYPVGAIYLSTLSTNPNTLLGFGTWVAFAAGQTLIGVGTSDQSFAAGATGGESNHTLSSGEMPSHTHTQSSHTHTDSGHVHGPLTGGTAYAMTDNSVTTASGSSWFKPSTSSTTTGSASANISSTTATNNNTGGGGSHNNLQPYIVVYMWQRTA